MSIRSALRPVVLLALLLSLTILPCAAAQASGFGVPAGDTGTPWIAPILDWLGLDAMIWGPVETSDDDEADGISTTTFGTDYTTTEEEDDDRSPAIDPNGSP